MKYCSFPGCSGGCHFCYAVKRTLANQPMYSLAKQVLSRNNVDNEIRQIAKYVLDATAPDVELVGGEWRWPSPETTR